LIYRSEKKGNTNQGEQQPIRKSRSFHTSSLKDCGLMWWIVKIHYLINFLALEAAQ
jgi:hypothetical protein